MSSLAWVALAGNVLLVAGPVGGTARTAALAGAGRLQADGFSPGGRAVRRVPRDLLAAAVALSIVAVVLVAGGLVLGLCAAVVVAATAVIGRDVLRRRGDAARRRELLAAVRLLVGDLEVGARPATALAAAADGTSAYRELFRSAAERTAAAGDAAAVLVEHPDTRSVGVAWRLGEDVGLALAQVLASVARDLAAGEEQRRNVAVALAGARASAALLIALPVLGVALGATMGARPWDFLFGSSAGHAVCLAGTAFDVTGTFWMRAILRRAELPAADPTLPLVLDLAAAALRIGRPVADALALAAPAAGDHVSELLTTVASLSRLGADAFEAWSAVPRDGPLGEVAIIGVRSATSGTRLASAFERLAVEIRAERAAAATVRAQRAGVFSLAPLAACFLPSFVCLGVVPVVASVVSSAFAGLS